MATSNAHHDLHWGNRGQRGAVLLEVVVGLALFVGASAVLMTGLNASLRSVERLGLNTHAANLAVTVVSELQLGIKSVAAGAAQSFDPPFEQWTWEATATPFTMDSTSQSSFQKVEVIIRHAEAELTYRLTEVMQVPEQSAEDDSLMEDFPF